MDITERIVGHEKLTRVFGCWPSFHDAEVISLRLDRESAVGDTSPTMDAVIHTWEMTNQVDSNGYYVLRHHVLVEFRFHGVVDVQLDGFNDQNVLFGLMVKHGGDSTDDSAEFGVEFGPSFGVGGSCRCREIEVRRVTPCDERGVPLAPQPRDSST